MKPAVGVTESMLTRLDTVLDDGPVSVDESVTELAASVSPTVPSVVHATETVKLGDAPVIEGVPHAAVPWTLRSGVDKPVIASLKRRVKLTVRDVVDVDDVDQVAEGKDESMVRVDEDVMVPGPLLPVESETAFVLIESDTVPVEAHERSMANEVPDEAEGVGVHEADPVAVKSAAVSPLTGSLKTSE